MELPRERTSLARDVEPETVRCPYKMRFLKLANEAGFQPDVLLPKFNIRHGIFEDYLSHSNNLDEAEARRICTKGLRDGPWLKRLKQSKTQKQEALLNVIGSELRKQIEKCDGIGLAPCLLNMGRNILDTKHPIGEGIPISNLLSTAVSHHNESMAALLASCATAEDLLAALTTAIMAGDGDAIQMLLELGANPNLLDQKAKDRLLDDVAKVRAILRSPIPLSKNIIRSWLSAPSLQKRPETLSLILRCSEDQQYDRTDGLCFAIHKADQKGLLSILDATWHWNPPDLGILSKAITATARLKSETAIFMAEALVCVTMGDRRISDGRPSEKRMEVGTASLVVTPFLDASAPEVRCEVVTKATHVGAKGQCLGNDSSSTVLSREYVGLMSRAIVTVLSEQASLGGTDSKVLGSVIESENVTLLEILLRYPITMETVDVAFPLLRNISKEARLAMTKLLLTKNLPSETVIKALREAVRDYSSNRDEALIEALLVQNTEIWIDLSSVLLVCRRDDLNVFRKVIRCLELATPTKQLLDQIISMEVRPRRLEFMEAISSQEIAVRILLPHLSEVLHLVFEEPELDVPLLTSLSRCCGVSQGQVDTDIIVPAMILPSSKGLEAVLSGRKLPRLTINRCLRLAIAHPFEDDRVRAERIELLLSHAQDDLSFGCEYLRMYLEDCLKASACGRYWPTPTFQSLLQVDLVFDEDFEYCLQIASTAHACTIVKMLLDQRPPTQLVDKALLATVNLIRDDDIGILILFTGAQPSGIALCEALDIATCRVLEGVCQELLKAGADVNHRYGKCIRSAISRGNLSLLETLMTYRPLKHGTVEAVWNHLGPFGSLDAKKMTLARLMLRKRAWRLCLLDERLKAAVRCDDLELCRLLFKFRIQQEPCQRGLPCRPIDVMEDLDPEKDTQKALSTFGEAIKIAATERKADIFCLLMEHGVPSALDISQLVEHAVDGPESMLVAVQQNTPRWRFSGGLEAAFVRLAGAGRAKACQLLLLFDERRKNHGRRHTVDYIPPVWYRASHRAWQAVWKSFNDRKIDECTAVDALRVLMKIGICIDRHMLSSTLESLIRLRSPCVKLLELLVDNGATAWEDEVCYGITATRARYPELLSILLRRLPKDREKAATTCFSQFMKDIDEEPSSHPHLVDGDSFDVRVLRVLLQNGVSMEVARDALTQVTSPHHHSRYDYISIAGLLIEKPGILTDQLGWTPLSSICSRGDIEMCKQALKHPLSRSYRLRPILDWFIGWQWGYSHDYPTEHSLISIFDELIAPFRSDGPLFSPNEILEILQSPRTRGQWIPPSRIFARVLSLTATGHAMWSLNQYRTFFFTELSSTKPKFSDKGMRLLMRWMKIGKAMILSDKIQLTWWDRFLEGGY